MPISANNQVKQFHKDQGGWMLLSGIMVIFFLVLSIGLAANLARTMRGKIRAQNSADNLAYSASIPIARGLNTITGAQHMIGEIMAVSIIHSGFYGHFPENFKINTDWLPKNKTSSGTLDSWHMKARSALKFVGKKEPDSDMAKSVSDRLRQTERKQHAGDISNGSIDDADMQLAWVVDKTYKAQVLGVALYLIPYTRAIGEAMITLAYGIQAYCKIETEVLDGMQKAAVSTKQIQVLSFQLVKAIHSYEVLVVSTIRNRCSGYKFPADILIETNQPKFMSNSVIYRAILGLPVEKEKPILRIIKRNDKDTYFKKTKNLEISQSHWVKAATPWVQYTRFQFVNKSEVLFFSRFSEWYQKRTGQYTLDLANHMKLGGRAGRDNPNQAQGIQPFLMADTKKPDDQGNNPSRLQEWRLGKDQARLHRLFASVGLAWEKQPASRIKIFRDDLKELGGFAQSFVYAADEPDANHPKYKDEKPNEKYQDTSGWDTLVWKNRVPHYSYKQGGGVDNQDKMPVARPNWEVKLVPVSLAKEALNQSKIPPGWSKLANLPGNALAGH